MTALSTKQRVIDLEAGIIMAVTDLHGDWQAYQRYRDLFLTLQAQGKADYFVLMGDLIHRPRPEHDGSLPMVLDALALQETLGSRFIYLCGNHELPHIYHFTLQKGEDLFTPRFEWAMGEHRETVITFFRQLPFYVRTKAGITLSHAGAAAELTAVKGVEKLFNWSHQQVLQDVIALIPDEQRPSLRRAMSQRNQLPYDQMVYDYLAVTGPDDPRYDDFLIGTITANTHRDFEILWSALFTRNEQQYGMSYYPLIVKTTLEAFSTDYHPQHVLVSGHIDCRNGYKVIANQQLRFASGKHAQPNHAARYLLFDAEKPVKTAETLLATLNRIND